MPASHILRVAETDEVVPRNEGEIAEDQGEIAEDPGWATSRMRDAVRGAFDHVPDLLGTTRDGASQLAGHLPDAIARARVGAHGTETKLQAMSDPTLRLPASASIGLAAGLYIAGARRLVTVAALASAFVVGSAIATRPDPVS
jgi:hypothetical protein